MAAHASGTIDLVFNHLRRGDISKADSLIKAAEDLATRVGGWHQWLWRLRIRQAKAELACAREDWRSALPLASEAIAKNREQGRPKYVVAGLETRAQGFAALGQTPQAIADLNEAVKIARGMGDPALFMRASVPLLVMNGSDALLGEARTTAQRILTALPNDEMRKQFLAAEPIRRLGTFDHSPARKLNP